MAAGSQTGGSYFVPGRGTTTRKKSGKAKSFEGTAPAPSGTTKTPEVTAETAPTVTISPTGTVTTSGFKKERAAKAAERKQKRAEQRVKRIVALVTSSPQKRSQSLKAPEAPKAPSFKPTGPTPKIRQQEVADHQVFLREQGVPKAQAAPTLKGTSQQRKAVRARVQQTKRALKGATPPAKQTGTLTPQEVANALARQSRKVGAGLTKPEIAEGVGVAFAESGASNENVGQGPEGHIGIYSESPAFGTPEQRTRTGPATRAAVKQFLADGRSWNPAWVHWQEIQGENETGADRAPQYVDEAAKALRGQPSPKAVANYKSAVKEAKELGLKVPPAGRPDVGKAPPKVVKKYKQALTTMKNIDSKGYEYVWGGGHGSFNGPYDCSGAISAMLHSVGDLNAPLVSGSMGEALEPGPGAITVFYNGVHTFAYIPALKKYWGTSTSNPGGGAGFFPKSVGDSEVASGNSAGSYAVGHVPGLGKKQALQLGAGLGSMTSTGSASSQPFPGMSLSSSGTSATIESGKGTKQDKPGFSNKPIKLTPAQIVGRVEHKLKAATLKGTEGGPSTSVLDRLEAKYS